MIGSYSSKSRLESALKESRRYGRDGHLEAEKSIKLLRNVIKKSVEELDKDISKLEKSNYKNNDVSKNLEEQLNKIKREFELIPDKLQKDIFSLSENVFSITLFGRTMVGKSTLMEILTHGDGKSIGKGSQRTTRDIREYRYKDTGMKITDVPGIAAFEGKVDEETAYKAAEKSDLVLFLISDDAPQDAEAKCLKKIIELGKPVICLMNVRANLDINTNMSLFKRDIRSKMVEGLDRLNEIKEQFWEYGKKYGQNWRRIPFVYVHLKSAFAAQQPEFAEYKEILEKLSMFDRVEKLIESEVIKNGPFYKNKAFLDLPSYKLLEVSKTLLEQSAMNGEQGRTLISKRRKFSKNIKQFKDSSHKKIDLFTTRMTNELKKEVADFAEIHYDDTNASQEWKRVYEEYELDKKAHQLLIEIGDECKSQINEIRREINAELKFTHRFMKDRSLDMENIPDFGRMFRWANTIISAGIAIASFFTAGVGAAIISTGVSILGFFGIEIFDDREEKIRDAREKLEKKLEENIERTMSKINKNMKFTIDKRLVKGQLNRALWTLDKVVDTFFSLSETQQNLAEELNGELLRINKMIVEKGLNYLEIDVEMGRIDKVAREPGIALMFVLKDGTRLPSNVKKDLGNLMKESVWFSFTKDKVYSTLLQILGKGINRQDIRLESIKGVERIVHISNYDQLDAQQQSRIILAQQLTNLVFMKEEENKNGRK